MIRKCIVIWGITLSILTAQKNPPLYIAAPGGLSLREGPGKDSKKIQLIPYGTAITNYSYVPDSKSETIDGYSGEWINVSLSDGKTGYIFDGYTIPLELPTTYIELDKYLVKLFGKVVFEDSIIKDTEADDYRNIHITHYESGVIYNEAMMYESYEWSIMNLQFNMASKVYLWYYAMEEFMWSKSHLMNKINYPTKTIESDTLMIYVDHGLSYGLQIAKNDGSFTYLKIIYQNGYYTLTSGSYI